MRATRVVCTGVVVGLLLLTASSTHAQLRRIWGADSLEDVTKNAISTVGESGQLSSVGGGSAAGEVFMLGVPVELRIPAPHMAPMSRELNPTLCQPSSSQLLIGLDGISMVTGNPLGGDSNGEGCSDSISGGRTLTGIVKADGVTPCDSTDGCNPAGSYTFVDWRDVLAMVYGGLNHNTSIAAINAPDGGACVYADPPFETNGDDPCQPVGRVCFPSNRCGLAGVVGRRNPARVNCMNPARQALVDSWNSLFSDASVGHRCRSGGCTKLRHAFRLDDLSGTTDIFAALISLPPVPPFTKAVANNSPMPDRAATANPFCNGGSRVMNKGDADYLDLDPIRRAVDLQVVAGNRFGLEQVGELVPAFGGNNNDANCMLGAIPEDHGSSTEPGIWPDPNIAGSQALLQADLGFDSVNGGILPTPYGPTSRLCLGLVLPVSLPTNYNPLPNSNGIADWAPYFEDFTRQPVPCDILDPPGIGPGRAIDSINMDTQHSGTALCPNGTRQPCDLPYKVDPDYPNGRNFNCYFDQLNPNMSGVQDMRIYNLHPVDDTGHYVRDLFFNPNIFSLVISRQARVVSAFYRLHVTRSTSLHGSVPTGGPCRLFTATEQIGCFVQANACSIGFAARTAVDASVLHANLGARLDGVSASTANVQNLLSSQSPVYPMARTLWVNSIDPNSLSGDEFMLLQQGFQTPSVIDPIMQNRNFAPVPAGVARSYSCPSGLPNPLAGP